MDIPVCDTSVFFHDHFGVGFLVALIVVGNSITALQGGPWSDPYKRTYGAPLNGRKYMRNWGEITPLIVVIPPLVTGCVGGGFIFLDFPPNLTSIFLFIGVLKPATRTALKLLGHHFRWTFEQWKKPSCLGYIGDYITHLSADYSKPL